MRSWSRDGSVAAGRVTSRRSQMSGVFQVVPIRRTGRSARAEAARALFPPAVVEAGTGPVGRWFRERVTPDEPACCSDVGTISVIVGGTGAGAQPPTFAWSRLAHFFQVAGSSSILMNTPPITGRARMPSLLALSVTYESTNGSRAVVSFR